MNIISLALNLLRRDWHAGELRTLTAALVIAVAAVSAIGLLTDRLGRAMTRDAAELLGGDLVINSTREPDPAWLEIGQALGMNTAVVYRFNSVLLFGDELLLCSVKAVTDNYPLRGKLRIADQPYQPDRATTSAPAPGTAWVDARVLNRLNAKIGDQVTFGASTVRLTQVLTYEPDQSGSLFRLAPRVLLNATDLAAAEVLGPGSRVRYRYLFAGDNVTALKQQLRPLLGPGHELEDIESGESRPSRALQRAGQFLNLTALLTIVLAAVAIALTANRYSQRHRDTSAMLRCLGAQRREVSRLYLTQLLFLVFTTTTLGVILGWLSHMLLLQALQPLLPPALPAPGWKPLFTALGTGILLATGFALPPLLRLGTVPPLRVLRRDLPPLPVSGWLLYGGAIGALYLLIVLLFGELGELLPVIAGTLAGLVLTALLIYGLLGRLHRHRLGRSIRNLSGHAATTTSQILAFAVTLMIMALIASLRTDLLTQWRLQLPEDVPNHFAFNLQQDNLQPFSNLLRDRGIEQPVYPIVRGRLTAINNEPVTISEETDTNRELNFTWTETLPADNAIVAGEWQPDAGENLVSVEVEYAGRLGLQLGDRITLLVGGFEREARVTSFRSVQWESFSPNFFFIFTPPTLADLPVTYLTSFHLPPAQKGLLRTLVQRFPEITIIEVEAILARLQLILGQTTLAVELMMVFVLFSGFTVLFAALSATADERIQEGALMRAVGASRSYLRRAWLSEFTLLGLLAGTLAVIGAEIASFYLYTHVFDLDYRPKLWWWLVLPSVAGGFTGIAGYLGTRRVIATSPLQLLQQ